MEKYSNIRCLVIGDGDVESDIEATKSPTIIQNYKCYVKINNRLLQLTIYDTGGQEEYDRLRPLAYNSETNVILLCFSLFDKDSYENVISRWYPETQHYLPNIPIILVGTKKDLHDDRLLIERMFAKKQSPITHQQGLFLKEKIKAVAYIECSSLTKENIKKVFDEAISIATAESQRSSNKIISFFRSFFN